MTAYKVRKGGSGRSLVIRALDLRLDGREFPTAAVSGNRII